MVRADVTKSGNSVNEQLLKRYSIKGVPTIIFIDAEGKERQELRLVDYIPAEQFMERMGEVMRASK